jgi:hypothetical protein
MEREVVRARVGGSGRRLHIGLLGRRLPGAQVGGDDLGVLRGVLVLAGLQPLIAGALIVILIEIVRVTPVHPCRARRSRPGPVAPAGRSSSLLLDAHHP